MWFRRITFKEHFHQVSYDLQVLKERCEQAELLCVDDDDDDENLYDDDYLEMQIQKLIDERKLLENKKQKLETEYDTLYKHVFKVSRSVLSAIKFHCLNFYFYDNIVLMLKLFIRFYALFW